MISKKYQSYGRAHKCDDKGKSVRLGQEKQGKGQASTYLILRLIPVKSPKYEQKSKQEQREKYIFRHYIVCVEIGGDKHDHNYREEGPLPLAEEFGEKKSRKDSHAYQDRIEKF